MQEIRIAIVHHDRLYRESVGLYLAQRENMTVMYSDSSLAIADEQVMECWPDVLLLDFAISRSAVDREIFERLDPGVKRIVVGVPDTDDDILWCLEEAAAAGYVLMEESLEDLINHIHAVVSGKMLCCLRIVNLAFSRGSMPARQQVGTFARPFTGTPLTRRESEIAQLIDGGLSNKEIAIRLHIEVSTVKNHVHNILDKLQIHNRHSAVRYLKNHTIPTANHS